MYANIIINITHEKLDKVFQYRIPDSLKEELEVGAEVIVPFGKNSREIHGYVVGFSEKAGYAEDKIKEIFSVAADSMAIEARLVKLAAWMKETYGGTMIQALKTVLPIKRKEREQKKRRLICLLQEEEGQKRLEYYRKKNQKARERLMEVLLEEREVDYSLAIKKLRVTADVIRTLEEQGTLAVESERVYRNPEIRRDRPAEEICYTVQQKEAIRIFSQDYEREQYKTYLIHGITGSGKTEVYIEMIGKAVEKGRQAIVLIPEIALTYQTVMRFYRRFGERVSIMNSRMSAGERYDQMQRAAGGEVDVMIGPRSALFTPFPSLGLIVIDEEHENTYKSEQTPRYHARETAAARAKLEGASLVLGSATPSLESYYRCQSGEYRLLELTRRAGSQPLPSVYTADMRRELARGNRSVFSDILHGKLKDRLEKGEQSMLFLNRRGYAGFISCRACGYVVKCPHCDVSLAAHNNGKLVCHYCGHEEKQIQVCPSCGSSHIGGFKAGTQQIEELVKRDFPGARVLRMDLDTTRKKDGYEKILSAFAREEADILIGTQMIVKGHDFPGVTLVGVLAADMSLYSSDYRAGERTFQLLVQAAGRAGRGRKAGEVVIQTYSPEHYSIQAAARQDYTAFYQEEIAFRKLMGYPPAEHLLAVLMTGKDEIHLETAAGYLKACAERIGVETMDVIGPATPYVSRISDVYRKILYLKCPKYGMLVKVKNYLEQYIQINSGFQTLRIQFDFNPMNIF
ncbi:MAG: primosomal protein N' [Dorea sp.]|jgi:primosomal protein N' (replication factor Y)|nr:primosomal protein N' [Dorea sp.]